MNKKILIVDDDGGLRTLYKEELKDEGFEILTANNGKEAIDKLEWEVKTCLESGLNYLRFSASKLGSI